jgi:UDP-N-acetylmuramoyl-tripeptide--D-alanyl-D-alanine ligase
VLNWDLDRIAGVLGGERRGPATSVLGLGTDGRTIARGALFVALRGPRHDGHDYLGQAAERGASAALVSDSRPSSLPSVRVAETRPALLALAARWREGFDLPLGAVAGANGKTTVKNMAAEILGRMAPTLATEGNQNNDIGVPLTLARLGPEHRHAVVEIGVNRRGEMAPLARAVAPTAAVVTSISEEHLEGLGDLAGVAREEGGVYAALPPSGTAVLDAGSPWLSSWLSTTPARRRLLFGGTSGDVRLLGEPRLGTDGASFALRLPDGELTVRLGLLGRHAVHDALAAAALATALGASPEAVAEGLAAVRPAPHRLEPRRLPSGGTLLDDCYNANPGSLAAALETAALWPGERWCVLGTMGELGPDSPSWHRRAGEAARAAGFARLFVLGQEAEEAARAFGRGAVSARDVEDLLARLASALARDAPSVLLVKGSRASRLERVTDVLAPPTSTETTRVAGFR